MAKEKASAVVVTTEHRGVFFGYVKSDLSPTEITLTDARNAVYWSQSVQGVLWACGQGAEGRLSDRASDTRTNHFGKITAVMACTTEAVAAWEGSPWK